MSRPVLTPAELVAADRRAVEAGTSEEQLVARAGRAVAWTVRHVLGGTYGRRVAVVCGKGNNGADGRVAAAVLRRWGVGCDLLSLDALDAASVGRAASRADAVIDAMFGTGFRGTLEGPAAAVAATLDAHPDIPVVSVDVPSGVDGLTGAVRGPVVHALVTVTFTALKPGLLFEPGRSAAGAVRLVDIGIEPVSGGPTLVVLDATDVVLPVRVRDAHKWSAGLMVVAGSPGMLGAALLVSHAAARCGAGMVVSGLPADAARRVAGSEVVTRALPATPEGLLDEDAARLVLRDLGRFRALALGPGLGRDDRTQAAVRRLVAEAPVPVVVDADALHALGGDAAALRVRRTAGLPPAVLTPHAGEYVRLAGEAVGDDRVDAARRLAARLHAVVLLKGPGTVVASPEGHACVNTTDSELLATAGTGDVLTGMIGGLLAQGVDAFEAAASAAWLHGRAAQLACTGDALVAGDLVDALPRTLASIDDRED